MKVGLALFALVAVALASSAPLSAETISDSDCLWICLDCRHAAKTHEADRQCTAMAAGCCLGAGHRPPSMGCSCGGATR